MLLIKSYLHTGPYKTMNEYFIRNISYIVSHLFFNRVLITALCVSLHRMIAHKTIRIYAIFKGTKLIPKLYTVLLFINNMEKCEQSEQQVHLKIIK